MTFPLPVGEDEGEGLCSRMYLFLQYFNSSRWQLYELSRIETLSYHKWQLSTLYSENPKYRRVRKTENDEYAYEKQTRTRTRSR